MKYQNDKKEEVNLYDKVLREVGLIWGPFPMPYDDGVSGMYMLGPYGTLLFNEIISVLRQHYMPLGFYEVQCPCITPFQVWKASGHVDGFLDPLIVCPQCRERFRGDKLLAESFPEILTDDVPLEDLGRMLKEVDLRCPNCNTRLTNIRPYSVMFETIIGRDQRAFLRPETATTTYLAYSEYLKYFHHEWPIKVFQIGKAFRNEINPRKALVRMREFHQAEFQIIIPPTNEYTHDGVDLLSVGDIPIPILTVEDQKNGKEEPTLYLPQQLVELSMVDRPILAWCMAVSSAVIRIFGFRSFRFRQHLYPRLRFRHPPTGPAVDNIFAWDIEYKTRKYGWVEMAGVHDRADYDCRMHDTFSQESFTAKISDRVLYPLVYEMAFGVERLLICIIDNALRVDEKRLWLDFGYRLAPIKCHIMPFSEEEPLVNKCREIYQQLWKAGVHSEIVLKKRLGARFRDADLKGVPFCLSLDQENLINGTVRLREIHSGVQKEIPLDNTAYIIDDLLHERRHFEQLEYRVVGT